MTTVTLILKGYFQHEDSKGHKGTIGPGDMQWMQAGRGIVHAEMPLFDEDSPSGAVDPEGLQLWIDLPKKAKDAPPTYTELLAEDIPDAHPSEFVSIRVIAGKAQGNGKQGMVESVVKPAGGAEYYQIRITRAGEKHWQPVRTY